MNDRAKYNDNLTQEQKDKMDLIRSSFSNMYDVLDINCNPSRELSIALTKLEEAQMWAIKGISRDNSYNK